MPATRPELIRTGIAAVLEGDYARAAAMFTAGAEVRRVGPFGIVRGREAIQRWLAPEAFELVQIEVTAIEENAERVLATCELRMRGTGSGAELANTFYVAFAFRGTQVSRMEIHLQRSDAAASAGMGAE